MLNHCSQLFLVSPLPLPCSDISVDFASSLSPFGWKLQVVVKASNIYPKDAEAPPCGVDDMTKLAYLHEPGVLDNLRSRYDINEIYVSVQ